MAIGLIHYPGIVHARSANFTFSAHGTSPSSAIIEITPQAVAPATTGNLRFTFGDVFVEFGGCHLDMSSFTRNSQGLIVSLRILDRRWRWREKTISGSYNLRNPDETIDTDTEKTPHQLAGFLLDALGEVGYDVTALPLAPRPMVQWDFASAAAELDSLCDMFGCRVVTQLNGRVKICVLGVGADLPALPQRIMDVSGSIDPPEIPDVLRVVFGPTRVQLVFTTEAIGEDTDKQTYLINELSYMPSGGWGTIDLGHFQGIPGPTIADMQAGRQDDSPRALAKKSVFRWYRINGLLGGASTERFLKRVLGPEFDFKIGTYATNPMKQFLPLLSDLVDIDPDTKNSLAPFVQGKFAKLDGIWTNSDHWEMYRRGFSIEADKGIIEFSDFCFRWESDSTPSDYVPADIYLNASVNIKHHTSMVVHRVLRDKATGANSGMGAKVYREEDVAGTVRLNYSDITETVTSATTNIAALNQEADYHLKAAMAEFQVKAAVDQSYAGLVPINCDGAIQQVTYTVQQGGGCTTRASRNSEYHLHRPTYQQRRDIRQVQANNVALLRASIRQGNRQLRGY